MARTEQHYEVDGVYVIKKDRTISLAPGLIEKLDDTPSVINSTDSTSTTDALSAYMGKVLKDEINSLKAMGRFLSVWDATTGLPQTEPATLPYQYNTGDYYIVGNVGSTNYKPNGKTYQSGVASTTVETGSVEVNDQYIFDGASWVLQKSGGKDISVDSVLSTTSTNPVENRVITNELNKKATASSLSAVASSGDYNDLINKPDFILDEEYGTSWATSTKAPTAKQIYQKIENVTSKLGSVPTVYTEGGLPRDSKPGDLSVSDGDIEIDSGAGALTLITDLNLFTWVVSQVTLDSLTNDAGFIKEVDIDNYIPQNLSELNDDVGFALQSDIPTSLSQLYNDLDLPTSEEIDEKLADKMDNPSGGTAGQVLTKTTSGVEWKDAEASQADVALTKEQYDALPDTKYTNNVTYFIYS